MNAPQKHATLIHAWADGAEVEILGRTSESWKSINHPSWAEESNYRIKPHKWQAEIDAQKAGEAIHWRVVGEATWREAHRGLLIADDACEYRIKPETIRFRMYLLGGATTTVEVLHSEHFAAKAEADESFIRWLGDWQEVEA